MEEERASMTCPFCGGEMRPGKLWIGEEGRPLPLVHFLLRWYEAGEFEKNKMLDYLLHREFIPLKGSDTDDHYHSNAWACEQCQKVITVFDMDGPSQTILHRK